MKKNKILVTGAAGCVGSNLVKRLAQNSNNEINILIHKERWYPFLDGLKIKVFYGDIRNRNDVLKAMNGCDFVYQVAGVVSYNKLDNDYMFTTHVNGVRNILEVAKNLKVKKVVVTASTAGIGIPKNKNFPLNEESPFDFKKYKEVMYMYSKHLTIKVCKEFANQGLNVSIISPTTIYGTGDIGMHIGKVVKKIKEEKMKFAPPGGNAVVSIEDTIDAHILIMEKGKIGENYIIADEFIPYIEMFNRIAIMFNSKKIKSCLPKWIILPSKIGLGLAENFFFVFGKKPLLSPSSINFSFKHRYFDSSKIRKELGWKPQVSFEETMQRAIEFYKKQNLL